MKGTSAGIVPIYENPIMNDMKSQGGRVEASREDLVRRYAAGDTSWKALRESGFEDYVAVLGLLGDLGLRPPIAPMDGPNVESRSRGRAIIRDALQTRT